MAAFLFLILAAAAIHARGHVAGKVFQVVEHEQAGLVGTSLLEPGLVFRGQTRPLIENRLPLDRPEIEFELVARLDDSALGVHEGPQKRQSQASINGNDIMLPV